MGHRRWEVTPGFCILWAFLILTLPPGFLAAAVFAALVHEAFHAGAVRLWGGRILGMTLGAGGMVMEVTAMDPGRELVCALAGPAGSLLLTFLPAPTAALCGLCQGLFNLLPLMPLDGGRALGCILEMTAPRHRSWIQQVAEMAVLTLLLAAAWRLGTGGILVWAALALRKFPCKPWGKRVQ